MSAIAMTTIATTTVYSRDCHKLTERGEEGGGRKGAKDERWRRIHPQVICRLDGKQKIEKGPRSKQATFDVAADTTDDEFKARVEAAYDEVLRWGEERRAGD